MKPNSGIGLKGGALLLPSVSEEVAFEGRRLRDIFGGGGLIGAADEDVRG